MGETSTIIKIPLISFQHLQVAQRSTSRERGEHMDFDTAVKLNIYETIARTTQAPTSADVAKALFTSPEEVEAAVARLHKKRLLVPEPGNSSRIRMAPPFSSAPTPFRVKVQDKSYYANCVWDA